MHPTPRHPGGAVELGCSRGAWFAPANEVEAPSWTPATIAASMTAPVEVAGACADRDADAAAGMVAAAEGLAQVHRAGLVIAADMVAAHHAHADAAVHLWLVVGGEIGRGGWRERGWQYV